jgi:hypothetical protein
VNTSYNTLLFHYYVGKASISLGVKVRKNMGEKGLQNLFLLLLLYYWNPPAIEKSSPVHADLAEEGRMESSHPLLNTGEDLALPYKSISSLLVHRGMISHSMRGIVPSLDGNFFCFSL